VRYVRNGNVRSGVAARLCVLRAPSNTCKRTKRCSCRRRDASSYAFDWCDDSVLCQPLVNTACTTLYNAVYIYIEVHHSMVLSCDLARAVNPADAPVALLKRPCSDDGLRTECVPLRSAAAVDAAVAHALVGGQWGGEASGECAKCLGRCCCSCGAAVRLCCRLHMA
jgi:hypothetical protein